MSVQLAGPGGDLIVGQAPGGGTVKVFQPFTPDDAHFAAGVNGFTGIAGVAVRNNHPLITFDDTAVAFIDDEQAVFLNVMPLTYNQANRLIVQIDWVGATANIGDVTWRASWEAIRISGADLDADNFGSQQIVTTTTDAASGQVARTSIFFTNVQADAISAGNAYRLQIIRDANAVTDTMVGDAQLLRMFVNEE